MRRLVLVLLALVAVLGAACFGDNEVPRDAGDDPGEDSPPAVRPGDPDDDDGTQPPSDGPIDNNPDDDDGPLVIGDEPPAGAASSGAASVDLGIGSYCWGQLCVDKIGHMTGPDSLVVETGDRLMIGGPLAALSFDEVLANVRPLPAEPLAEGPGWIAWPGGPTIDGGLEVAVPSLSSATS